MAFVPSKILESLRSNNKLMTVIGAYLLTLPIGMQWYWGNMSTYVYSYVIKYHPTVEIINSPWLLSLYLIAMNLSFFAGGIVSNYIGRRKTAVCGILAFISGLISSYFTLQSTPALLNVTLGVVLGTGSGILFATGMSFTLEWATGDVGFLTSFFMSSINVGSVLVNQATTYYINPYNEMADITVDDSKFFSQSSIVEKVPFLFLLMGIVSSIILVIGFGLIRLRDTDYTEKDVGGGNISESLCPDSEEKAEKSTLVKRKGDNKSEIGTKGHETNRNYSPIQLLKSKVFYILCFCFILVEYPYILMANYYKIFGIRRINDDQFFANVASLMVLLSGLVRVVFGLILDKIGLKHCMIGISAIMGVGIAHFYFSVFFGKWFYAAMTIWLASISCAQYNSFMVAIVTIFGSQNASSNVGLLLIGGIILNMIAPVVIEFVLNNLGWFSLFAVGSGVILIELILIICYLPDI